MNVRKMVCVLMFVLPPLPVSATAGPPAPVAGATVKLYRPGAADDVLVASEEPLLSVFADKSPEGFRRFVRFREDGKVAVVPNGKYATVLQVGRGCYRVKFLYFERAGESWWVESAYVVLYKQGPTVSKEEVESAGQKRKAVSLWRIAQNLEKSKKNEAALRYYRRIVRDCPTTTEAKDSSARIKALGGNP